MLPRIWPRYGRYSRGTSDGGGPLDDGWQGAPRRLAGGRREALSGPVDALHLGTFERCQRLLIPPCLPVKVPPPSASVHWFRWTKSLSRMPCVFVVNSETVTTKALHSLGGAYHSLVLLRLCGGAVVFGGGAR